MELVLYGVPVAIIIVGLVEIAKNLGLPSRWAAPLALVLGVLFAVLGWLEAGGSLLEAVLIGILTGLSASGLYSGGKAVAGG